MDNKVLQQRALTATVFAIVMLGGLFWSKISFVYLFDLITIGCLWEFLGLTLANPTTWRKVLGTIFGMSAHLSSLISPQVQLLIISFILPFVFILLIIELFTASEKPFQNVAFMVLGLVYIGMPLCLPVYTSEAFDGGFTPNIAAGLLFLTWSNDTFAYLVGSRIGKTPLLPRISPKKTWEGTLGGAVMCVVTAWVISMFFTQLDTLQWFVLGIIVAIFGGLGDLVESMLKRSLGVKDSGDLMPGHGGLLDRFDAFIFILPFAALYLFFFAK